MSETTKQEKIRRYMELIDNATRIIGEIAPQGVMRDQAYFKLRESLFWVSESLQGGGGEENKDD